jgi:hypothetical protein
VDRFGENSLTISHLGKRYNLVEWNTRRGGEPPDGSQVVPSKTAGPLSKEMIDGSIKANRSYFMKCFAHHLQRKPDSKGSMVLNFTILESGKVTAPEVIDSTFFDRQFHDCIVDSLTRIPFPSFDGSSVSAMIPMQFQ